MASDDSFDFVFSLGVLHHIPDTAQAMRRCVAKLKPGGHFLVYLYYDLDNRGPLYRAVFVMSTLIRRIVASLPKGPKHLVCEAIAFTVYLPLANVGDITPKFKRHDADSPTAFDARAVGSAL